MVKLLLCFLHLHANYIIFWTPTSPEKMEPTLGVKDKNTLKLGCSGRHCFWYRGKEWQIANSSTLRPNNNILTIEDVNYY